MKTILLSILAAFILFVPNAAAHTYLDTTNPEDGAVVVEPLQSIALTYAGKIEEGSTFKVVAGNGEQFETTSITLVDGVLTGTFENPLPNNEYTVQWNSISEDGHPLSGQFAFTVDVPVTEEIAEEEDSAEQAEVEDTTQNDSAEPSAADEDDKSKISPLMIIGGILLLIIAVSIITLVKRKKTK
ncbi:copper resistance CopC family protein [Solibacillus silvestris]|uniref:copper resistance CopC family protein n=1 Tax=Solibacillus silvestris TaxID=76853 RepID=UPI003F7E02F5